MLIALVSIWIPSLNFLRYYHGEHSQRCAWIYQKIKTVVFKLTYRDLTVLVPHFGTH